MSVFLKLNDLLYNRIINVIMNLILFNNQVNDILYIEKTH